MAIYSLDQIVKIIMGWEKDLLEFYKILDVNLKDDSAKAVTSLMKKEQTKIVEMMNCVDATHNEEFEYNKNLPDYERSNILPNVEVTELSSAKVILEKIFDFEEEILGMYKHLREVVAYEKSKDLLDMLIQMKLGQVKKIKSCMDSYDLAM